MSDPVTDQARLHVERSRLPPAPELVAGQFVGVHDALHLVTLAVEELLSSLEASALRGVVEGTGARTTAALIRLADLGVRLPAQTRALLDARSTR